MTPILAAILTGLVVDQTGAYVTNATVQYLPGRTVQTDITGRFTTPNLRAGIYGLRLSAPGFFIGRISPMPLAAEDVKELPPITLRTSSPDYPAFEIRTLKIPAKTPVEIDGWIDPPETRKTLQPSNATAICL